MTDSQPSAAMQLLGGFADKLVDLTDDVLFGWRRAMSAIRLPKKPAWATTALSPGSSRLDIPVSMPAIPVQCSGSAIPFGIR